MMAPRVAHPFVIANLPPRNPIHPCTRSTSMNAALLLARAIVPASLRSERDSFLLH
jgi:hypothetical protein